MDVLVDVADEGSINLCCFDDFEGSFGLLCLGRRLPPPPWLGWWWWWVMVIIFINVVIIWILGMNIGSVGLDLDMFWV